MDGTQTFRPSTFSCLFPFRILKAPGLAGSSEQAMKIGLMAFLADTGDNNSKRPAGRAEK